MRGFQSFRNNPIVVFTASRYVSYGLLFIRGILVAAILGPYLFGVWGFLTLTLQYLTYTSLGIEYATTVQLATDREKNSRELDHIASVAVTITLVIAIVLFLFGILIQVLEISMVEKYSLSQFVVALGIIAGLSHIQHVLTNIYRVHKKLIKIALSELFNASILLIVAFNFREDKLIPALLIAMIVSGIFSLIIFLYNPPFRISLVFDTLIVRSLLVIGIPLLVYNVSFYLIMVSARTILSIFYPVEAMGYYTLANAITTATLLGLRSIIWVVFPDILAKTHSGIGYEKAQKTVENINKLYNTSVFLLVFVFILFLPILFMVLPQYKPAINTIIILLLSQAILSASFGYNSVAIARRKQNQVAKISILAVIVVTVSSLIASYLQLHFEWIALSVLLGSIVYTIFQAKLGSKILNFDQLTIRQIDSMISIGSIFAVMCFLVGAFSNHLLVFGLIGMAIFLYFNRTKLKYIWSFAITRVW